MAGRATSGKRIERYADKIDAKLRADEDSDTSMQVFTSSYLGQVLEDCGYKKRGSRNLALIQHALVRRDVYPDPPLTAPRLDWKQRIHFTRTPPSRQPEVHRARFPAERDLETFLVANFDYLFPDLTFVDRQYRVQSGQIDILAKDRDGYVVIELKLDKPSDDLVFAVDRYMDDVANWVAKKGAAESVRGLVIAARVDESMREKLEQLAEADGRRIDWMVYEIQFELRASTQIAELAATQDVA